MDSSDKKVEVKSYFSMKELLGPNTNIADVPIAHQHNLEELKKKLNQVRSLYGKPMIVTSGYRNKVDHVRIYSEINAKRKKEGKPELPIPTLSKHLIGCAADIHDPKQTLQKWCLENVAKLEEIGLWMEDFSATKTWVHFQTRPPKSGKRFFLP